MNHFPGLGQPPAEVPTHPPTQNSNPHAMSPLRLDIETQPLIISNISRHNEINYR
jgi:hypothetical protein